MRANHKIVVAGIVLLIAAGVVWWKTMQSRLQAEAALATVMAQRTTLQSEVRATRDRIATAERNRADQARALAALPPAKSKTADAAAKTPVQPRTITEIISNSPKTEMLMLRWQREVVTLEYGPFFRLHGITAEQIRRFQDNWVKRVEQDIDLRAVARLENGPGEKETAALQQQSKDASEAAQAEVLGPDGYRELQEYVRTVVARNVVVLGLAGAAALEGISLAAQQGHQLWQAAIETTGPGGATAQGGRLVDAIDWDTLDTRARQILTPAQYALFNTSSAPSGFQSRWKYQLDAMARRAQEADAAAAP
jgi:hypothetical protein